MEPREHAWGEETPESEMATPPLEGSMPHQEFATNAVIASNKDVGLTLPGAEQEAKTAQIAEYAKDAQHFLTQYEQTGFFATYAKDVSLKFKIGNGFFIDLEKGEVNLDASWFHERGFSHEQILWASLHELSHFIDNVDDPKGMEESIAELTERAKAKGSEVGERLRGMLDLTDPNINEAFLQVTEERTQNGITMSNLQYQFYQIYHGFTNTLDDVYVNNIVERRAPRFQRGTGGGDEVARLYGEKLFDRTDYTQDSRHAQLGYALLRTHMLPDEEIALGSEVTEVLSQKYAYNHKLYSPENILKAFYAPKTGRNTTITERSRVIAQTLEPAFEKLLNLDIEDWLQKLKEQIEQAKQKKQNPQGGNGHDDAPGGSGGNQNLQNPGEPKPNSRDEREEDETPQTGGASSQIDTPNLLPFENEVRDQVNNGIDQLPEGDVEKAVVAMRERKDVPPKEPLTPEEIEKRFMAQQKAQWLNRVSQDENEKRRLERGLRELEKIEAEIAPYLDELAQFWRGVAHGESEGIDRTKVGHFQSGVHLDIPQVIRNYPEIAKGNIEGSRNFERFEYAKTKVEKPEVMRVRIVGDLSASMFFPVYDERGKERPELRKVESLKKALVLILRSLDEFGQYLDMNRATLQIKTAIETEAYVFGSASKKVKSIHASDADGEQKDIVNTLLETGSDQGSTADYLCMEAITRSLDEASKKLLMEKKVLDMVLVITDGESDEPETMKQYLRDMNQLGMVVRGLQVGDTTEEEKFVFQETWGEEGEILGNDLGKLLPAIIKLFKEYFKDVRL